MLMHPGRPQLANLLSEMVDQTKALRGADELRGLVVGTCGPASLTASVRQAERGISGKNRDAVGGVEVVEEYVILFASFVKARLQLTLPPLTK